MLHSMGNAIDSLYEAFSDVPVPATFDECTCGLCVCEEHFREMLTFDVRDIPMEYLSAYAESAMITCGSEVDYLYFLPRLLHTNVIETSMCWSSPELTGERIALLKLKSWPQRRRQALESFFEHAIRYCLQNADYDRMEEWICAIAISGVPVLPCLKFVESDPTAVLAYFQYNSNDLKDGKLSNAFFRLPCAGHDEIVRWFHCEPILAIVNGPADGGG